VELLDAPAAPVPGDEAETLDEFAGELVRGLREPGPSDQEEQPIDAAVLPTDDAAASVEETTIAGDEQIPAEPLPDEAVFEPLAAGEPAPEPAMPDAWERRAEEPAIDESALDALNQTEPQTEPPLAEAAVESVAEEQTPSLDEEPSSELSHDAEPAAPLDLEASRPQDEAIDVTASAGIEPPLEETSVAELDLTSAEPLAGDPAAAEAESVASDELVLDEPRLEDTTAEEPERAQAAPVASDDVLAFLDFGEEPSNSDDSMVGEVIVPRQDAAAPPPAEPAAEALLDLSAPPREQTSPPWQRAPIDVTGTPPLSLEEIEADLSAGVVPVEAKPQPPSEPPGPITPAPPPAPRVAAQPNPEPPPMKIQFFSAPGNVPPSGGLVTMTLPAGPGGAPSMTPPPAAPKAPAAPRAPGAAPLKFVSVGDASAVTVTLPAEGPAAPRGPAAPPPKQPTPPPGMVITPAPAAFSGAAMPATAPGARPTAVAVPRGATLKGRTPAPPRPPTTAAPLAAAQDDVFVGIATGTPENVRVEPTKQPRSSGMDFITATSSGALMDDDDDEPRDVFSMGAAGVIEHEEPAGPGLGIRPVQELSPARPQPAAKAKGARGPIIPPKVPGWGAPRGAAPAPAQNKPAAKPKEPHWPTLPEPQVPSAQMPHMASAASPAPSGTPAADSDISFDDLFGPGGLMAEPQPPPPATPPGTAKLVTPKPAKSPSPDATDYDLDSLLTAEAKDQVAAQPDDADLVQADLDPQDAAPADQARPRRRSGGRGRLFWLLLILAGVLAAAFLIYKYFPPKFLAEGELIYERGAQIPEQRQQELLTLITQGSGPRSAADARVREPAPPAALPASLLSWVMPPAKPRQISAQWVTADSGNLRLKVTVAGSNRDRDEAWLEELLAAAYRDKINQALRAEADERAARRDMARTVRDRAKLRLQVFSDAAAGSSDAIENRPSAQEIASARAADDKLLQQYNAALLERHALAADIERLQSAGAAAAGQPAVTEKDDPLLRELVAKAAGLQGKLAGAKETASQSAGKAIEEARQAAQEKQREYDQLVARAALLKGDPAVAEVIAEAQKYQQDAQQLQQDFVAELERFTAGLRELYKSSEENLARHRERLIADDPDLKDLRDVEQEKQKQLLAAQQHNLTRDVRILQSEIDKLKENMVHRKLVLSTDPHYEQQMKLLKAFIDARARDIEQRRLTTEKRLSERDAELRKALSRTQGMSKEHRELAEELERKAEAMRVASKAFNDLAAKADRAASEQVRQIEVEFDAAQEKVAARRKELSDAQQHKLSDAQAAQLQPKRDQLAQMDKALDELRQQKLALTTRQLELDRRQRSADEAARDQQSRDEQLEAARAELERLEKELAVTTQVAAEAPSVLPPGKVSVTGEDRRLLYVIGTLVVALLLSAVGGGGRSERRAVHLESAHE
jgi:hypothetical protein